MRSSRDRDRLTKELAIRQSPPPDTAMPFPYRFPYNYRAVRASPCQRSTYQTSGSISHQKSQID
ncbi:hypothetical protein QUB70_24915 [Microcoleus sp. A003_D6]|uniref:hypothetical protein n=1 Tax=Microcoleus sp. A003_D6 TaxID=3055266 RepID=UPI002FD2FED1